MKYQQLKFKIFGKSDKELEDIFRPLEQKYAAVRRLKNNSPHYIALMSYFIFLYDPGTDLNHEFVRLADRKQEACKLSKLNAITDTKILDSIFSCRHADALDVIQILLTEVYHDRKYREWQTLQKELDEYTEARWEPVESTGRRKGKKDQEAVGNSKTALEALETKSKLRKQCEEIHKYLDTLEKEIFGDHVEIKEAAYQSRFDSPESFSKALKVAV